MGSGALRAAGLAVIALGCVAPAPARGGDADVRELRLVDGVLVLEAGAGDDRLSAQDADGDLLLTADGGLVLDQGARLVCVHPTPHAARCDITAVSAAVLDGGAGDDELRVATAPRVPVVLRGGDGRDALHGSAADETFDAGNGDDEVTTGGGRDTVDLGRGADRVSAADGGADVLDCGSGPDVVERDDEDTVRESCEVVGTVSAPPVAPAPVAPHADSPPPPAPETPAASDPAPAPAAAASPAPPSSAPAPVAAPEQPSRSAGPLAPTAPNLSPQSGTILVRPPGATAFTRVAEATRIRTGTVVDATDGVVKLVSNAAQDESMRFSEGVFRVRQSTRARPLVEVTLVEGDLSGCPRASAGYRRWTRERARPPVRRAAGRRTAGPTATLAARKRVRRLWGRGRKGRFRTVGREGSASVRGTEWLTEDTCTSTRVRVEDGEVDARDRRTGSTARLRSGEAVAMPFTVARLRRIARDGPSAGRVSQRGRALVGRGRR